MTGWNGLKPTQYSYIITVVKKNIGFRMRMEKKTLFWFNKSIKNAIKIKKKMTYNSKKSKRMK